MKTDIKFLWNVIEAFEWDKRSDYHITPKIVRKHGLDVTRRALIYATSLRDHLYKVVDKYETDHNCRCGEYGGDDSFGDMLWHAVGKGEKYYHQVLDNPKILDALEYEECFGYCKQSFPGGWK